MLHEEDEKYLQIREKLRSLPKVNASDNFMVSLQHKINLIDAEHNLSSTIHKETHERINQGAFARFFGFQQRPWLIPALSFTVVIFLVLTVVYLGYFNTTSSTDQRVATTNAETTNQNTAQNGNNTTNNSGNSQEGGTGNNSSSTNTEEKIGNTDSQPGNDEGLLATNDDKLGQTDSYNNKRINTSNKLPVTDVGRQYGNMVSSPNTETTTAESPSSTEMEMTTSQLEKPGMVGTSIDGGRTKAAMRPFDENSGVSVDQKKKDSSKNPRNIREVSNIGKTTLEELMDALNGE